MGRMETRLANETWTLQNWDYYHGPPGDPPTWESLINDDDDTTFIYGYGSGGLANGNAIFGFASMTLASDERCAAARAYWHGGSMGGGNYNMDVWLIPVYSGDGGAKNFNEDTGQAFWDHWTDWWGREFSFVECRDMRVGLRFQVPGGTVTTPKVSKLNLDFDIRNRPVASSVGGPNGSTLTPTVTWANDYKGDTANARQVRIIRASDFAVVYDSGRLPGSATSQVITSGLVQGVTYYPQVQIASDFLSTDWWSGYSDGANFTTFLNQSSMPGTTGMTATAMVTSMAASTMPATSEMTETPIVIALTAASMPSLTDLLATYKKGTCATCSDSCTCFLAEDGFFSGTLDFAERNYTTVEGDGSTDNPFVIHFLDQDLFRPKTAEINFQDGTIVTGTTYRDARLITPGNSMTYESPMRFIIRDIISGEEIFVQSNYFIIGASVTFAEIADAATTFRRIVLTTETQDPILGTREIVIGGQTIPGGITDPLTLGCSGFVPGIFTNYASLASIVSPVNLYISQNSGSTLAISNVKIWVTQI